MTLWTNVFSIGISFNFIKVAAKFFIDHMVLYHCFQMRNEILLAVHWQQKKYNTIKKVLLKWGHFERAKATYLKSVTSLMSHYHTFPCEGESRSKIIKVLSTWLLNDPFLSFRSFQRGIASLCISKDRKIASCKIEA